MSEYDYQYPAGEEALREEIRRVHKWGQVANNAAMKELREAREYLREKNEIIKAFAGPTGMTPEDVAYMRERVEFWVHRAGLLEGALRGVREYLNATEADVRASGASSRSRTVLRHTVDVLLARSAEKESGGG